MEIGTTLNTAVASLDKQLQTVRQSAESITKELEIDQADDNSEAGGSSAAEPVNSRGTIHETV